LIRGHEPGRMIRSGQSLASNTEFDSEHNIFKILAINMACAKDWSCAK